MKEGEELIDLLDSCICFAYPVLVQEFQIVNVLDSHIQRSSNKPIRAFLERKVFRNDFLTQQFIELESELESRLHSFSHQFHLKLTFTFIHYQAESLVEVHFVRHAS